MAVDPATAATSARSRRSPTRGRTASSCASPATPPTHTGTFVPSREIEEIAWLTAGDGDRVSAVDRLVLAHLRDADLLD